MKKKIIGIFVCMLLIATVLPVSGNVGVESTSMLLSSGNTLYVGGNGTGNYTRIQDAIDDASDGDMVFVYDDSSPYYENVVVDKSITLKGENKETTVINGSGIDSVIEISTDHVHIEGFTVTNCLYNLSEAGINIFTDWNTIRNNNIENQCMGIRLSGSLYNLIENNTLKDNRDHISLRESNNNTVQNNTLTLTQSDNLHDCTGIRLSHSSDNLIENNEITGARSGIFLDSSYNVMIHDYLENIISDNSISGKGIGLSYSCNNIIIDNKILDSAMGIDLLYSNNNIITGNSIGGMLFFYESNNNIITGNRIMDDDPFFSVGILLVATSNIIIRLNTIQNNSFGLLILQCKNSIIEKNNFIDNRIHVYFSFIFRNFWDSNYWDNWIGFGPKIIFGSFGSIVIPWFNFDWRPAGEPYDI